MMKRLIIALAVMCFSFGLAQAQAQAQETHTTFIKGQAGAITSPDHINKVSGTAKISYLHKIYKNIYGVGSYQDINTEDKNLNDYTGKVLFYSGDPDGVKPVIYLFTGAGGVHDGETGEVTVSSSVGFGVLGKEIWTARPLFEVECSYLQTEWLVGLNTGFQIGF